MSERAIWPQLIAAFQALGSKYVPAMEATVTQNGVKSRDWYWLLSALTFEPQPVTAARMAVRHPYVAVRQFQGRLQNLADEGLLAPVEANAYRLTEVGRALVQRMIQSAYAQMDILQPLPQPELETLAGLLERAVQASLQAPEPERKDSLTYSRKIDPGKDAPVMVRIDQYLTDLNAFRDDSHIASWAPLDVSGPTWEALTHVWRAKKLGLDELCGRFERRGHERLECLAALEQLAERGWVEDVSEAYILTSAGRKVRQAAEKQTDRLFHLPFKVFDAQEFSKLEELLARFRDALQKE